MNIKTIITGVLAILVFSVYSHAKEGGCPSNISISAKKMEKVLKSLLGNGKVLSVSNSPVNGLYEVILEVRGKRLPVYVDCSLNHMISGEIIDIKERRSLTREKAMELAKALSEEKAKKIERFIGKEKVEKLKDFFGSRFTDISVADLTKVPATTIIFGDPKAKYTIYVIDDPECPYCAKFHNEMLKVLEKRKDIKFEIILFPLPFHKHAEKISQRIICEKSMDKKKDILEASFEAVKKRDESKLRELGKECEKGKKALDKHDKFIRAHGIGGTPTLIFPHGIIVPGYMPADKIIKVMDILK
ncbi:DsbC family protein [Persephonella sp.]